MRKQLAGLKEECAKAGRDFSKLDITVMISLPDGVRRRRRLSVQWPAWVCSASSK